jgi:hypothetical protein
MIIQAGIPKHWDCLAGGAAALLGPRKVGRLIASWYWSGTEYADNTDNAWDFNMNNNPKNNNEYGLAVRSG